MDHSITPNAPLAPGLYLVATPIGNLEDITLRALRILRSADRIACEDTRQTAKLLNHFGISTPTVSYHLHNEAGRADELIAQLKTGVRIALVSDAGTPAIADPGADLVSAAIAANIAVYPIPGANAALCALIAGGLSTERFTFHGFLPSKSGQRRTVLEQLRAALSVAKPVQADDPPTTPGVPGRLAAWGGTHIFYETPHRILEALEDIAATLGPTHQIVLARELTKLHEEFLRGPVSEVLATLQQRPTIRGEIVLLLDGTLTTNAAEPTQKSLADEVSTLIRSGLPEKDALKQVAKSRGLGKSEAYREYQRTKR
ncbi:MAG TPA: 16S rRNA (cytidine(1402)-2'-O)-methyltransferase [Bryocella sp.]|nr:16S rRNA (cytidine(1402)-2'-O)-methyltransferase [Bryocella sp.]